MTRSLRGIRPCEVITMKVSVTGKAEVIRIILKDGHTFKVRPITREDKDKLRKIFYRLSPQTRYFRFGHMKEYISDQELDYYTNVHPPETHAYVGLTGEGAAEELIRAVGSLVPVAGWKYGGDSLYC